MLSSSQLSPGQTAGVAVGVVAIAVVALGFVLLLRKRKQQEDWESKAKDRAVTHKKGTLPLFASSVSSQPSPQPKQQQHNDKTFINGVCVSRERSYADSDAFLQMVGLPPISQHGSVNATTPSKRKHRSRSGKSKARSAGGKQTSRRLEASSIDASSLSLGSPHSSHDGDAMSHITVLVPATPNHRGEGGTSRKMQLKVSRRSMKRLSMRGKRGDEHDHDGDDAVPDQSTHAVKAAVTAPAHLPMEQLAELLMHHLDKVNDGCNSALVFVLPLVPTLLLVLIPAGQAVTLSITTSITSLTASPSLPDA